MPHKPGTGAIFGVVSEEGVAKEGAPVTLLDMRREQGIGQAQIIARQLTVADGGFVFNGLNTAYGDYAVFASDEDGAEPKNALIRDRITPVPAHSGSTWLFNWRTNAIMLGAAGVLAPYPAIESVAPRPFEYPTGGNQLCTMDTDFAPEMYGTAFAANTVYPLMQVRPDGHIGMYTPPLLGYTTSTAVQFTIEWWLDLDAIAGTHDPILICGDVSRDSLGGYTSFVYTSTIAAGVNGNNSSPASMLHFERATKIMRARVFTDTGTSPTNFYSTQGTSQVISYNCSSLTGVHHFVFVYRSSGTSELFVDGSSVAINYASPAYALVNGNSFGYFPNKQRAMVIGGMYGGVTYALGGQFRTGPAAWYLRALTASEVLQQYQNMTQETLPVITGYVRKLFEYIPAFYYRMNDVTVSATNHMQGLKNWARYVERVRQHLLSVSGNPGDYAFSESSPVLGGNSIRFLGGASGYFREGQCSYISIGNRHQMTFCGWVKVAATPSSTVQIFETRNVLDRYLCMVQLNTSRQLVFVVDVGSNQTFTFNEYALPLNTWQFVCIVVSLYDFGRTIELYVGSETVAPDLKATKTLAGGFMCDALSLTDWRTNSFLTSIGQGFNGWLAELAVLPVAFSPDDVQDVWEAKDTV